MIDRFHIVEDGCVILRRNGVYKQANVFTRGQHIYAGLSSSTFIQLFAHGHTSIPAVRWDDLELPFEEVTGPHDRLVVPFSWRPEAKVIEHKPAASKRKAA